MQHYITLAFSVIVLIAFFALYKPKRKDFSDEKLRDFDYSTPEIGNIVLPVEEELKNSVIQKESGFCDKEFKASEIKRYRLDEKFELIIIAGVVYLVHDAKYSVTMLKESDGCPLSEIRLNEKKNTFF